MQIQNLRLRHWIGPSVLDWISHLSRQRRADDHFHVWILAAGIRQSCPSSSGTATTKPRHCRQPRI